MPSISITISGRTFEVACEEGEENYLKSAAATLNDEAEAIVSKTGRLPESRMLLMSGLLLADKTVVLEDRIAELEKKIGHRDAVIADLQEAKNATKNLDVDALLGSLTQKLENFAGELEDKIPARPNPEGDA